MQSDFLSQSEPTDPLLTVSVGLWLYTSDGGITSGAPLKEPRCSCRGAGGPPAFRKCHNWIESFHVNIRCGLIWPCDTDIPELRCYQSLGPLVPGPAAPPHQHHQHFCCGSPLHICRYFNEIFEWSSEQISPAAFQVSTAKTLSAFSRIWLKNLLRVWFWSNMNLIPRGCMHVDEHADGLNPVVCKCLCHAKQLESTAEAQRHIRAPVWKASALGCCLGPGPSVKHVMMFGTVKRWFSNPDPTSAR